MVFARSIGQAAFLCEARALAREVLTARWAEVELVACALRMQNGSMGRRFIVQSKAERETNQIFKSGALSSDANAQPRSAFIEL
jgi:hypothetical protein